MQQVLTLPPPALLDDASLFLDFDGTLVDLAPTPDAVTVSDRLSALVARLADRLDGRIAIVSGRSIDSIEALFGAVPFAISGSHGLELRWPGGDRQMAERPAALDRIIDEMTRFAHHHPGVLVERKPLGAALHYRGAPAAQAASDALAHALAQDSDLHVQTGKMMIELRVAGADKGTALDRMMTLAPMAGHRPVFLGDDDTDEPAMVAAAAHGGCGILVGAPRPSAAAWNLPDVAATLDWLEATAA